MAIKPSLQLAPRLKLKVLVSVPTSSNSSKAASSSWCITGRHPSCPNVCVCRLILQNLPAAKMAFLVSPHASCFENDALFLHTICETAVDQPATSVPSFIRLLDCHVSITVLELFCLVFSFSLMTLACLLTALGHCQASLKLCESSWATSSHEKSPRGVQYVAQKCNSLMRKTYICVTHTHVATSWCSSQTDAGSPELHLPPRHANSANLGTTFP